MSFRDIFRFSVFSCGVLLVSACSSLISDTARTTTRKESAQAGGMTVDAKRLMIRMPSWRWSPIRTNWHPLWGRHRAILRYSRPCQQTIIPRSMSRW